MKVFEEHYDEIGIDDTRFQIRINDGEDYYNQIVNDVHSSTPQVTYKDAWRSLVLYLTMLCGWNIDKNIYNFLYSELQNFEDEFKYYLVNAFDNISDYYNKNASAFALNLVNEKNSDNYNLINKYGSDSGHNNLLHKLLMENRLSFQEVADDIK